MQKINLIIKLTELSIYLKQKQKQKKTSGLKCANFEKYLRLLVQFLFIVSITMICLSFQQNGCNGRIL